MALYSPTPQQVTDLSTSKSDLLYYARLNTYNLGRFFDSKDVLKMCNHVANLGLEKKELSAELQSTLERLINVIRDVGPPEDMSGSCLVASRYDQ